MPDNMFIDTNILVYAFLEHEQVKHDQAVALQLGVRRCRRRETPFRPIAWPACWRGAASASRQTR